MSGKRTKKEFRRQRVNILFSAGKGLLGAGVLVRQSRPGMQKEGIVAKGSCYPPKILSNGFTN